MNNTININYIKLKQRIFFTKRKIVFLLAGHKVDFIAPCGANKSTFWPASRTKIVCNTGKTFILLVWFLPSLCSGIKLHTRKINFFFPSCTMYYCWTTILLSQRNIPVNSTKYSLISLKILIFLRGMAKVALKSAINLRPWINQISWPNSCKSFCKILFLLYKIFSWRFRKYNRRR